MSQLCSIIANPDPVSLDPETSAVVVIACRTISAAIAECSILRE